MGTVEIPSRLSEVILKVFSLFNILVGQLTVRRIAQSIVTGVFINLIYLQDKELDISKWNLEIKLIYWF